MDEELSPQGEEGPRSPVRWPRRWWKKGRHQSRPSIRFRLLGAALALIGGLGVLGGLTLPGESPAGADGPAPCTVGGPPYPFHGFCATYSERNTWYGSYGPGFPTPEGWAFCADPPASGGDYPAPDYDYVPSGPPFLANTSNGGAMGFAFSQSEAMGWWNGSVGQFTADQAAVAGKLLYDAVVWGSPVPSMDPGVLAAYDNIDGWFNEAIGTTGTPELSAGLVGGSNSFVGSASEKVHVQFPGSGLGVAGLGLLLSITNGTFNSPSGPTSIGVTTDAGGDAIVPIFNDDGGSVTVSVTTLYGVGQTGLEFFSPTARELSAQGLAAFAPPTSLQSTQELSAQAPTGTVSIHKAGNDTAYFGLQGAVFDVIDNGGNTVASLTTDSSGNSPDSTGIPAGTYTVHEQTPPAGYQSAPDQTVVVVSGTDTQVSFTGAFEDMIQPGGITIRKSDAQTNAPLQGAVFDVRYDSTNDGVYDQDLGACTTGSSGGCSPGGNDGPDGFLPGNYQVKEITAPPGYYLDPSTDTQTLTVAPGGSGSVEFSDYLLGSVQVNKTGDDSGYVSIEGAAFTLSGPSPITTSVGTLSIAADGLSNTITGLIPGTYTLTETTPPAGYQPINPIQVQVEPGVFTTRVNVLDHVQPATLTVSKVDKETNAPVAGAVFDIRYDSRQPVTGIIQSDAINAQTNAETFDTDLGTCTTNNSGMCSPNGNDGPDGFLPGNYQVTEVTAPSGYYLDPSESVQDLQLSPAEAGTATFEDARLVPVEFQKVATGNVDPSQVILSGAVIDVTQPISNAPITSCVTSSAGTCETEALLISGGQYCWNEQVAPPGLSPGANGCFTASETDPAPITVTDPGEFVAVRVLKVDAANVGTALPSAEFDLYRVDGGTGPPGPQPPADAATEKGETWVARATTDENGVATFPLQFPGYSYCAVEEKAPTNYVSDATQRCTPVLKGTTDTPAPVTTIIAGDVEARVDLQVHKFNSRQPNTGIPGAVYDLYVEGKAPPSIIQESSRPPTAQPEPGDAWFSRGTTNEAGVLIFDVPAGYAWCVREVSAPADYLLDPALHCTSVLVTSSPLDQATVAIPETLATVHISAYKYNSLQPSTVIPDATYELLAQGVDPPGAPAVAPPGSPVPDGDFFWAQGTTNSNGVLTFAVPAGFSWCLHEISAPPDYRTDTGYHCTEVITTDTAATDASIALPEIPTNPGLAFTGGPSPWLFGTGTVLFAAGSSLLVLGRRRHKSWIRSRLRRTTNALFEADSF